MLILLSITENNVFFNEFGYSFPFAKDPPSKTDEFSRNLIGIRIPEYTISLGVLER
ncbi:hypothetical protein BDZ94DRAFT_1276085 [Collybia nuda]|uniref:Uncharacterized protein n=1 Tax=Collybia nuda TaxID=64659 RepID=A0A9P5XSY4_9AGAR|nr:hypothetical protein BDZ94DRAFT_1276085 [Collybia nuda]